jgi:SET family sugar efflux transporter-like MFS transporter
VTTEVRLRRPLPVLLVGVLLLGVAESMSGPYLVVFGADRAHLSPLAIGVFVSLMAVSGMAVSTWLGGRYDRLPSRAPALWALAASSLGYALLSTTTSYALLLVISVMFLGTGFAAFPQLFALARGQLDRDGLDGDKPLASTRGTPALRSVFSLAWAIGPLGGAALLAWHGFSGLFLATALVFGLVALAVLRLAPPLLLTAPPVLATPGDPALALATPPLPDAPPAVSPRLPVRAMLSFGVFYTALFSGSIVLPLYVTGELDRPNSDVGLMFSVCALVEVPSALALMVLPPRISRRWVIQLGMGLLVGYFVLITASTTIMVLVLAQVARGIGLSVVSTLGITHFQDLSPDGAGRGTTLFSNTSIAGSLASGIIAGATAQALGYRAALLLCGVLTVVAWALLAASERRPSTVVRPL